MLKDLFNRGTKAQRHKGTKLNKGSRVQVGKGSSEIVISCLDPLNPRPLKSYVSFVPSAFVPLCLLLFILLSYNTAFSFSLGSINVKNGFGERLEAVIPFYAGGGALAAVIGSQDDYKLLGVERPGIIDDINIQVISSADSNMIRIYSDKVLFYPSFELIVKASKDGDTIIERYLIAIDLRQSLSLSLSPDAKETPVPPVETKEEITPDKTNNPLSPLTQGELKEVVIPSEEKKEKEVLKVSDVPLTDTVAASEKKGEKLLYGPIKKGETLYQIAKGIRNPAYSIYQTMAALWDGNMNKFVADNMNGLKEGAYIDYTDLEKRLAKISHEDAQNKIDEHNTTWVNRYPSNNVNISSESEVKYNILPLPVDNPYYTDIAIKIISLWKAYMAKGDLSGLMSLYSKDYKSGERDFNILKGYKERFLNKYHNINIEYKNVEALKLPNEDILYAAFVQEFSSLEMKSIGLKGFKLKKEGDDFRIIAEEWFNVKYDEESAPFVIHVSSVNNIRSAFNEANRWRRLGFKAYYALYNIEGKGIWYRILVDRFSYPYTAAKLADSITKAGFSSYVKVKSMPYLLDFGAYDSEDEVIKFMQGFNLYKKLLPFYIKRTIGGKESFNVLAGAYVNKEDAEKVSKELKTAGHENSVIVLKKPE